jgi:iron complex outermembrane receptor protein
MFRLKTLSGCVAAACGGIAAIAVVPTAWAQDKPGEFKEKVEIVGSAIKRVQQEGPAPVELITRKDIERTGATSVNELMRSLPSLDIFDQGEISSNSPSGSGTANLAMRGLDSSNVLVLLNGRRLPVNGLYDSSGAGAAVDINMIPISAIERIEILKDGGSAIYGADAVAGVINFVTKRDYQGIEARAGYGISSRNDGQETTAGFSAGFGDLNKDRFNAFFALDYFKRDPILRKDRDISKSVDFRRLGGNDNRSTFAPSGNYVDGNTFGTISPYNACPPGSLNVTCRYDFNSSILSAYNGADRLSAMALGSFLVTPDIRAFLEVIYAKTEDRFDAHPAPDFFIVPAGANPPPAASDAGPFGAPGFFLMAGRFLQGGGRFTVRESTMTHAATGLEGTNFGLDWKVAVGRGVSEVTNQDGGYYNQPNFFNAVFAGQIDPTRNDNDPALVESLKVAPLRVGKSTLDYVNAQVSGEALQMPAGPLQYAVGLSTSRDKLTDTPDPLTQQGLVLGSIQQAPVAASRRLNAAFLELGIPVVRNVEMQVAARYDDYPQESKTSGKAAIKYQALPSLMFRASFTESFRAPALKQLYGAQEEGAINVTDDDLCVLLGATAPCNISAFNVNGSNPDLKAEKGQTINIGSVFDLGTAISGSIDFWRVYKKDNISVPTIDTAVREGRFDTSGGRLRIFTNLQNIAELTTSGVDVDLRLRLPGTAIGSITVRDAATYYYHQKTRSSAQDDWAEFIDTYALPRWRNVFAVSVESGPWTVLGALRSVGGFYDTDRAWPLVTQRRVPSHHEVDSQVSYMGIKNLTLTGGIKNLFDAMPPFSTQNANSNQYSQQGFAELYTSRGRFYYVTVAYKFR